MQNLCLLDCFYTKITSNMGLQNLWKTDSELQLKVDVCFYSYFEPGANFVTAQVWKIDKINIHASKSNCSNTCDSVYLSSIWRLQNTKFLASFRRKSSRSWQSIRNLHYIISLRLISHSIFWVNCGWLTPPTSRLDLCNQPLFQKCTRPMTASLCLSL